MTSKHKFTRMRDLILCMTVILMISWWCLMNLPGVGSSIQHSTYGRGDDLGKQLAQIESAYGANFYRKHDFVNVNGLVSRMLGQRLMNQRVKLNNGHLTFVLTQENMEHQAQQLVELNQYLSNKEIPMFYIQAPFKVSKYDQQLPVGVIDYGNVNADHLIESLDQAGVEVLDLQAEIVLDGLDHYALFFKTDHHWKPQAGFWAFTKIARFLEASYDYVGNDLVVDIEHYTIETCTKCFLGGAGKRTGIYFAGVEDFDFIYPQFATTLSLSVPSKNISRYGSFYDVFFDKSQIDASDLFEKEQFTTYVGGNYSLVLQRNDQALNTKKILLVRDSFALVVQPYLSLLTQSVDAVDLRYFEAQTLREYIEFTDPDLVIVMYSPSLYTNEKMFEFGI